MTVGCVRLLLPRMWLVMCSVTSVCVMCVCVSVTKPENKFAISWPPSQKSIWRYNSAAGGHIWIKSGISRPNFDKISQSAADILLLPVSESKRPSYWSSTTGFNVDFFVSSSCIGSSTAELRRRNDLKDGSRQPCWICFRVMIDHPRRVIDGPSWSSNFDLIGFIVSEMRYCDLFISCATRWT